MSFIKKLIESGYVFDKKNQVNCYVRTDVDGFIHLYKEGKDVSEWHYAKMTYDHDVIMVEQTFKI